MAHDALEPWSTRIDSGIAALARKLYYSEEWNRSQALKPWVIRHMIDCVGVTEADVRDLRYHHSADLVTVRLWNHRKFVITGLHMFQHEQDHISK